MTTQEILESIAKHRKAIQENRNAIKALITDLKRVDDSLHMAVAYLEEAEDFLK